MHYSLHRLYLEVTRLINYRLRCLDTQEATNNVSNPVLFCISLETPDRTKEQAKTIIIIINNKFKLSL